MKNAKKRKERGRKEGRVRKEEREMRERKTKSQLKSSRCRYLLEAKFSIYSRRAGMSKFPKPAVP